MKFLLSQCLLLAATVSAFKPFPATRAIKKQEREVIPSTVVEEDITANFISSYYGLDAPQLSAVNSSSFDWWYFDAVSTDLTSSLVIVFYTAPDSAFPFLPASADVTIVGIYAGFPNGTATSTYLNAEEAIVTPSQDGSSGVFQGTGASWAGARDDSGYIVTIDSPSTGIYGTFTLKSIAPAHYPCGPVEPGQNLEVGPNIGWSNAVPDAVGLVDFAFGDTKLAFTGVAYHDKNWSDQPFEDNVASWYWGHGRVGGYSLVWFDFLAVNGTEYVSAYVSKGGKPLVTSCTPGSIKVRPIGANDEYPPTVLTGNPGGFSIDVNLEDGSKIEFQVSTDTIVAGAAGFVYTRWTGVLNATTDCGEVLVGGQALFEAFKLTA